MMEKIKNIFEINALYECDMVVGAVALVCVLVYLLSSESLD